MSFEANVQVREATLDDYVRVCELIDELDALHRVGAPWLFGPPPTPPRSPAYFAGLLRDEKAAVLVAELNRVVCGVAFAILREAPELPVFRRQTWGVLDGLVVDPGRRRQGIGRTLTRAVEAWAGRSGAMWVELNVYNFNRSAKEFYESLGYGSFSEKFRKPTGAG